MMTIRPIIARAGFPLMVVAGATVCLAAVVIVGPEIGAAGLIGIVAVRSLLVIVQGLVLVGLVHNADRNLRVVRAHQDRVRFDR